jgi:hypothetical protein
MFLVYNTDYIHRLLNESKKWIVTYIWDQREYEIKKKALNAQDLNWTPSGENHNGEYPDPKKSICYRHSKEKYHGTVW